MPVASWCSSWPKMHSAPKANGQFGLPSIFFQLEFWGRGRTTFMGKKIKSQVPCTHIHINSHIEEMKPTVCFMRSCAPREFCEFAKMLPSAIRWSLLVFVAATLVFVVWGLLLVVLVLPPLLSRVWAILIENAPIRGPARLLLLLLFEKDALPRLRLAHGLCTF